MGLARSIDTLSGVGSAFSHGETERRAEAAVLNGRQLHPAVERRGDDARIPLTTRLLAENLLHLRRNAEADTHGHGTWRQNRLQLPGCGPLVIWLLP
jgi:hypothetical protein